MVDTLQYPVYAQDIEIIVKEALKKGSGPEEFGSIFIWGKPGIGKSQIISQIAEKEKVGLLDLRLTLCDSTDLRGIPIPIQIDDEMSAKWVAPNEFPRSGRGIMFLDDFPTAPPLVQAAAYQLTITPHRLGEYQLPNGWIIVAAGNTLKDRSLAHRMPKALANRFTHLYMEADSDMWVEWAIKKGIHPAVIAFIKFKPNYLHKFDPTTDDDAFPTPRSWEMVSKSIYTFNDKKILETLINGQIGQGTALEFNHFFKIQDKLPNLDSIFDGNDFLPPMNDPGLSYSLITALALKANSNQFNRLIEYSMLYPAEFAVLMVKMLCSRDTDSVLTAKSIGIWMSKYPELTDIKI